MKTFALCVTVLGVVSMLPAPLAAQSFRMKAEIPFNFLMDGKGLPAGEYILEAGTMAPDLVVLRNADYTVSVVVAGNPVSTHDAAGTRDPQLRFDRYGDKYFLSGVWPGPTGNGIELNVSGRELNAAKERVEVTGTR